MALSTGDRCLKTFEKKTYFPSSPYLLIQILYCFQKSVHLSYLPLIFPSSKWPICTQDLYLSDPIIWYFSHNTSQSHLTYYMEVSFLPVIFLKYAHGQSAKWKNIYFVNARWIHSETFQIHEPILSHIYLCQGCQTHCHQGPHQPLGCLQRAECNFRTV